MIAISCQSFLDFGCPHCGFRSASRHMSIGGTASLSCGECKKPFLILAEGTEKSAIGISANGARSTSFREGEELPECIYPELEVHPREGIPSHGPADKRPEKGGEFFRSRGIGTDAGMGCFVCGKKPSSISNIAAFVQCKAAGDRLVAMFDRLAGAKIAFLDYREHEPDWLQLKIGGCQKHRPCLEKLHRLVSDGVITESRITEARSHRG